MLTTTIPAIERQLDFRASPERLWRALTEDDELSAWFGQGAHLDLRAGRTAGSSGTGMAASRSAWRSSSRCTRLAWRWGDVGKSVDDGSTLVEFRLEPLAAGGTRLHLRESGFALEPRAGATPRAGSRSSPSWRPTSRPSRSRPGSGGPTRSRRRSIGSGARSPSPPSSPPGGPARPTSRSAPGATAGGSGRARAAGSRYRIEAVEPPRYLCWSWATVPEVPLADADQVLRTEWALVPRDDGGTDLHLFESGFTGPDFEARTAAAGTATSCRPSASTSARPDRRPIHSRPAGSFHRDPGRAHPRFLCARPALLDASARIPAPNSGSVLWGCVVSTGLGCLGTRAEVPSGLVKPAAKRSNCQQAACSRPRGLGRKVSVEAASPPRAVEASLSGGAARMRLRSPESSPI